MLTKTHIRQHILRQREALDDKIKNQYDISIFNKLVNNVDMERAKVIFVYVSFQKEVDTFKIIDFLLSEGKIVLVPKVLDKKQGMIAVKIDSIEQLSVGYYGILEPRSCHKFDEKVIDLILMPGVAFDRDGGRVGYGGGFYDRFLKLVSTDCRKIALCYSFQILSKVPMEENDIYLDGIITE